jgi:hypothetical protein
MLRLDPLTGARLELCALLAAIAAALGGCAPTVTPPVSVTEGSPSPPATRLAIPLPTNLGADACAGVGFTGDVVLIAKDGDLLSRYTLTGVLAPTYWPPGSTMVEDPPLWRILNPEGQLLATSGEDITPFLRSGQWRGWHVCVTTTEIFVY